MRKKQFILIIAASFACVLHLSCDNSTKSDQDGTTAGRSGRDYLPSFEDFNTKPSLSADGLSLVFTSRRTDSLPKIYKISGSLGSDTLNAELLHDQGIVEEGARQAEFSAFILPDATKVLVTTISSEEEHLYLYDFTDSTADPIKIMSSYKVKNVAISSNSQLAAVNVIAKESNQNVEQIWIINLAAETPEATKISSKNNDETALFFHPEDSSIIFIARHTDNHLTEISQLSIDINQISASQTNDRAKVIEEIPLARRLRSDIGKDDFFLIQTSKGQSINISGIDDSAKKAPISNELISTNNSIITDRVTNRIPQPVGHHIVSTSLSNQQSLGVYVTKHTYACDGSSTVNFGSVMVVFTGDFSTLTPLFPIFANEAQAWDTSSDPCSVAKDSDKKVYNTIIDALINKNADTDNYRIVYVARTEEGSSEVYTLDRVNGEYLKPKKL